MLIRQLAEMAGWLTKTGLSDNAGGVKHVSTTLLQAPVEERHFALIGEVLSPNQGSLLIRIQVGNSVRPMHLFGHKLDHDYYFELLVKRSGPPNQLLGVRLHTIACSERAHVRTERLDCS
jgi:hypothetical protein